MINIKGTIMDASEMGKKGFGFKRRERHTKAKAKASLKSNALQDQLARTGHKSFIQS